MQGGSSLLTVSCCWGGGLVLVRVVCACHALSVARRPAIGGSPHRRPPRRLASPAPFFLADCVWLSVGWVSCWTLLVGWRELCGVLPRINGTNVSGESSIMTGVYERWCSSTLHIGWGLCDSLCLVLVCRDRYGFGGGFSLFWDQV